jgi:nucleoside-diphosphate-sugar epimerase
MYGIAKGDEWVYEESKLNPLTAYGRTKILAEQELAKLADDTFTPVFLRPSTVYGISPLMRVDIVLNNLVGWAVTTGKIRILSNGSPWRPVIHVEDIANAFIAALIAPKELVHNQAFNVGEKESYRIKDMAELIHEIIPQCQIEFANEPGNDERSYRINSDKFRNILKDYYQQKWEIKKGIKVLYDEYKNHGLTYEEFIGNKYIRLNQLKKLVTENKLDNQLYWKQ